ncbi:MAG: hypothetical protein Q9181_004351 [Wetmoreana brouardii]
MSLMLLGVYYTGGSVNPARTFGPCVVLHSFYHYHWVSPVFPSQPTAPLQPIYWLGPFLGALLASGFFKFIKMLEYETANPGQDFDDRERDFFDPSNNTSRPIVYLARDGSALVEEGEDSSPDGLPDLENPGPELQQPPPVDERERNGTKGGSGKGVTNSNRGFADDEATTSETRYKQGPDAEAGKATPRETGRA